MLPPDVRVARDAQDLLIECCVGQHFIINDNFVSIILCLICWLNSFSFSFRKSEIVSFTIFIVLMSDKVMVPSIEAHRTSSLSCLGWCPLQHHSWLFVALMFSKISFTLHYCFVWYILFYFFVYFLLSSFGFKIWSPILEVICSCLWYTDHYSLTPSVASCDVFWHFLVLIQFILPVFWFSFCCSIWLAGPSSFHLYLLLPNPIIQY